jgi:hypothetical protein
MERSRRRSLPARATSSSASSHETAITRLSRKAQRVMTDHSVRSSSSLNVKDRKLEEEQDTTTDGQTVQITGPQIKVVDYSHGTQGDPIISEDVVKHEEDYNNITASEHQENVSTDHREEATSLPHRSTGDTTQRTDTDNWSESGTIVPKRNLTAMDVAALILNKMVGMS